MSDWITDRLPTAEDADKFGDVWVTVRNGFVCEWNWRSIKPQMPWQPTNKPAPYVKPKRWTVEWHDPTNCWHVIDSYAVMGYLHLDSSQAAAAQRICDIYNEVMP
jgi:hypothetical protein